LRRLAIALALAALSFVTGCGGSGGAGSHAVPQSADLSKGRDLFAKKCASCHTLAAATAQGTIGPNLDNAFGYTKKQGFDESTVYDIALRQIQIAAPPMPDDLVTGDDAVAVAAFIARCAGNKIVGSKGQDAAAAAACQSSSGPIEGSDPKTLFTAAGCSGCHTFSKAGSTGTVGPNLDQIHPTLQKAITQITNGGAIMPPFKDRLSKNQIEILAKFVSGG
jgi:mono/diheme cytochrome c family protein